MYQFPVYCEATCIQKRKFIWPVVGKLSLDPLSQRLITYVYGPLKQLIELRIIHWWECLRESYYLCRAVVVLETSIRSFPEVLSSAKISDVWYLMSKKSTI